jgi:hypothetical protein
MSKVRMIRTMIVEYEPNPKYYPKGSTIEEMASIDIEQMKESGDYESLFDNELISDELKFEIVD